MKYFGYAFLILLAFLMVSCIEKEPLNAECDIEAVTIPGDVLNRSPQIYNDKVILIVKREFP